MAEQKEINWGEEAEQLSEGGDGTEYFKPDEGETEITFLDEGTRYTDEKKFDEKPREYVKFRVKVDGEEKIWDFGKGGTPGSKFGQIARYAAAKNGLEGETVTWFRQGTGQQTNHILMDLKDIDEDSEGDKEAIFDEEGEE